MRRATRELRELRAVNQGIPVRELDRPHSSRRKKNTPTHIGYEDQAKIDNLNSDIRRLSSSTLGSASSRAREIRARQERIAADLSQVRHQAAVNQSRGRCMRISRRAANLGSVGATSGSTPCAATAPHRP